MTHVAPAPPALFSPACAFVRDLPPELVEVREISQVRQSRPLSGAAIGFLRFLSALRPATKGNSHGGAETPLKSLGTELCPDPLSILDRREFQCTWIVGAGGGIATCCGAPVLTGKSWCPEHRARVFAKGGAE